MSLQSASPRFPPINLWNAPATHALNVARTETIQQSLRRLGFGSRWKRDARNKRARLHIWNRKDVFDSRGVLSASQAIDLIELFDGTPPNPDRPYFFRVSKP